MPVRILFAWLACYLSCGAASILRNDAPERTLHMANCTQTLSHTVRCTLFAWRDGRMGGHRAVTPTRTSGSSSSSSSPSWMFIASFVEMKSCRRMALPGGKVTRDTVSALHSAESACLPACLPALRLPPPTFSWAEFVLLSPSPYQVISPPHLKQDVSP